MKGGGFLWLAVGLAFALLATAWAAMFFFAGKANIDSVPLVTPGVDYRK